MVRAPGLEPESGSAALKRLLRGLSADALGDLERGRDALARSLLSTLAGVGR